MRCVATRNTLTIGGTRLRALVKKYIAQHRSNALQEKEFFEQMPSLQLAVYHAAFALDHRQPPRRYSHQCRIRLAPMRKAHQTLLRARTKLESTKSFDELHALVAGIFAKIHGLGVLYTYDTALRLP